MAIRDSNDDSSGERIAWSREALRSAMDELMAAGVFHDSLLEAKPAWMFPHSIVIGKVRQQGDRNHSYWVICGQSPVDYVSASVATTPREAARHFAMKWQLEAERHRDPRLRHKLDPDGQRDWDKLCDSLETRAASLFELINLDALWSASPTH